MGRYKPSDWATLPRIKDRYGKVADFESELSEVEVYAAQRSGDGCLQDFLQDLVDRYKAYRGAAFMTDPQWDLFRAYLRRAREAG